MISYGNDPARKAMFIERFANHCKADEIIQRTGFNCGRGCFIYCTMNEYNHESFANQIGPLWLAHLCDKIFKRLSVPNNQQFGTDVLAAIPVGVDLDPVKWKLAIARHRQDLERLVSNTEPYALKCKDAISDIIKYCESQISGNKDKSIATKLELASAAMSAAALASVSIFAAWITWSAAWSVDLAPTSASESASATAKSVSELAELSHYEWEAETLIKLLKESN